MRRAVIDIETVPVSSVDLEATAPEDVKKLSLDACTARIACIGVIELDEFEPISVHSFIDADEAVVLNKFWDSIRSHRIQGFVAHNGLSFDLPFIWRRSVVNQVRPSMKFDLRKFSNGFVFDTMNVWSNWETRNSVSLQKLATALGIGNKSGVAAGVCQMWQEGRFSELTSYCLQDCVLTYECYCRMNFERAANLSLLLHRAMSVPSDQAERVVALV